MTDDGKELLTKIGFETSLRYSIQLITAAHIACQVQWVVSIKSVQSSAWSSPWQQFHLHLALANCQTFSTCCWQYAICLACKINQLHDNSYFLFMQTTPQVVLCKCSLICMQLPMQKRKGSEVDIEDIGRVYSMFVDVKRSTQFLIEFQHQYMYNEIPGAVAGEEMETSA